MNKVFVPTIQFENIISDEKRIESAYEKLFTVARRNIMERKQLTNIMSEEYTKVQYAGNILNDRGSVQEVAC